MKLEFLFEGFRWSFGGPPYNPIGKKGGKEAPWHPIALGLFWRISR